MYVVQGDSLRKFRLTEKKPMTSAVETTQGTDWRLALLANREKTLEYLYARTYPVVLHYVKERQGREEDAQDLLQDAIILFFEKVVHDRLVLTAAPTTYLVAICKNRWRQEREKRSRQVPLADGHPGGTTETPEPDTHEATAHLLDYVNQLGEKCRDILVQFYYFGQQLEQIAADHGYRTIRSATVQKFKCLERLRKAVSHLSVGHFK
jgi:RNA polymerase sigma factor (sigma-70 family)